MASSCSLARCYLLVLFLLAFPAAGFLEAEEAPPAGADPLAWPPLTRESKPWTYWWWPGSAVRRSALTGLLEEYAAAGFGGVHVIPVYGVQGFEDRSIGFLSPRWLEMFRHTVAEARRLGMGVDLTTGTGWPFGGPHVAPGDADARLAVKTFQLDGGARLEEKLDPEKLRALVAFSRSGQVVDLAARVDRGGGVDWTAPEGQWTLYAAFLDPEEGRRVKRAAPGGAGRCVNPFSSRALRRFLEPFTAAFAGDGARPRAFYHDSFEYRGDGAPEVFDEFLTRRGYDLRRELPALVGSDTAERAARVKADYRQTLAELLEEFTRTWVAWCHERGCRTRNQAHGSPGNILDLYAAADIPETEIFGPSRLEIPGLRRDPEFQNEPPDPLVFQFASSAAHVTGKRLVAAETCTWLGEHFKVALTQVKPEIDQLLAAGINHLFYHGIAYSPPEEPWPGWLFYASTNFGPANTFWRELPALNATVARCQSVLQSGSPASDLLVYFPVHDLWHRGDGLALGLTVHALGRWFHGTPLHATARLLRERGYTFDFISDRLLEGARGTTGGIETPGGRYRALVLPECEHLPLRTAEALLGIAAGGGTVLVHGDLPRDVPGWGDLSRRRERLKELLQPLREERESSPLPREVGSGEGRFWIGADLEEGLHRAGVEREAVVDHGVELIRRRHSEGFHYFLAHLGSQRLDGWVELATPARSAVLLDPRFPERRGLAALRRRAGARSEVYLQLDPGESVILRTFTERQVDRVPWRYLRPLGHAAGDLQAVRLASGGGLEGPWEVEFLEGGPERPEPFAAEALGSWTELGGPRARAFSGTALYRARFRMPAPLPAAAEIDWVLDLGEVRECARLRINGHDGGVLWSLPFRRAVGPLLRPGENTLEVEVTNLPANRIADMDRRGVRWKKFHDINFVNIRYRPFDASAWPPEPSGLLGPVLLEPVKVLGPEELGAGG